MEQQVKATIEKLGNAFEEFKSANDERLAELEKKGHADPLLEEKVNKLSEAVGEFDQVKENLEKIEAKLNRQELSVGESKELKKSKELDIFSKYITSGDVSELPEVLNKTARSGIDPDGGYLIPTTVDSVIYDLLEEYSDVRSVAGKIVVTSEKWEKTVNTGGTTSGWIGKEETPTNTNTPTLKQLSPYFGEIYAQPLATQTELDDAAINIEGWLSENVVREFAKQENTAFTSGDGVKQPKGFLSYATATTADSSRAFGTLQYVAGGHASLLNDADKIIDLTAELKDQHQSKAVFMAGRRTLATIRKLKDSNGQYLWVPGLEKGSSSMLLDYRTVRAESMPAIAANAFPLAFGNFEDGYKVVDLIGIRVLRDPYTSKPYIKFYTTKRVGGFVMDSEAIKLLKIASS